MFPHLPVRQWVLSVPKRLRFLLQRDALVLNMVLRIFLRVIEQSLCANCPGTVNVDKTALHIGAVAFIHRFGSSLNAHVHFHVCVVDGVFEQAQATLRKRILRAFVGRGLLESFQAQEMLAYQHSGFSVDAGVCIEGHDCAALV